MHTRLPVGTRDLPATAGTKPLPPTYTTGGLGRHTGTDAPRTAAWRLATRDCAHSTDIARTAAVTLAAHSMARAKQVPGRLPHWPIAPHSGQMAQGRGPATSNLTQTQSGVEQFTHPRGHEKVNSPNSSQSKAGRFNSGISTTT